MKNEGPQDQPWPQPYERPNQKWLCGRSDRILPCPLGPDARGKCGTKAECSPVLETKPGEEKGRYRCTRRPEYGGPCEEGPLPTGTCSHPVPPCAPRRSMRYRRALFSYWVLGLTVAALLLLFHGEDRFSFANPGALSSVHAQPRAKLGQQLSSDNRNCSACHRPADGGFIDWVEAAAGAKPHPFQVAALLKPSEEVVTRMDTTCAECHRGHQFHHASMQQEQSCLKCHKEHEGDGGLLVKSSRQCIECHGNRERMDQAHGVTHQVVLRGGAEEIGPRQITRLRKDHPEFRVVREKMSDPNTLRFNHQKHLTAPVVGPDGRPLQCAACHVQDAAGEYHQRIRFAQHCQSCHSLQFDPETPELQLPHGEVEFVKAFLGGLAQQYESVGQTKRGITEKRALKSFVEGQMKRMEERQLQGLSSGDEIFLSRERRAPASGKVVPFYGCAYCHEVSGQGSAIQVVKADVPDRWLTKGAFHHREHAHVNCVTCHYQARASVQTADILLPSVKTCAACHRSSAAPGENCTLCHTYHHWKDQLSTAEARPPEKL